MAKNNYETNWFSGILTIIAAAALIGFGFYFLYSDAGVGGNQEHHIRGIAATVTIGGGIVLLWVAFQAGWLGSMMPAQVSIVDDSGM